MKKLLAVAAAAGALALVGCGAEDGSSCETTTAPIQRSDERCTLAPGTTVTVRARPACQNCFETRPSCTAELRGGDIELDTIYRQCSEDAGCPNTSCGFTPIDCVFTTPAASAQYRFAYPTTTSRTPGAGGTTTIGYTDVTIAPGGGSSCQL
jgi:hypothetical protein